MPFYKFWSNHQSQSENLSAREWHVQKRLGVVHIFTWFTFKLLHGVEREPHFNWETPMLGKSFPAVTCQVMSYHLLRPCEQDPNRIRLFRHWHGCCGNVTVRPQVCLCLRLGVKRALSRCSRLFLGLKQCVTAIRSVWLLGLRWSIQVDRMWQLSCADCLIGRQSLAIHDREQRPKAST